MQPTLPKPIRFTATQTSPEGRTTTVKHMGFMYDDGERTWKLLPPVTELNKDIFSWLRFHLKLITACQLNYVSLQNISMRIAIAKS